MVAEAIEQQDHLLKPISDVQSSRARVYSVIGVDSSVAYFFEDMGKEDRIDDKTTRELARQIRTTRDPQAIHRLTVANLRLVPGVVEYYLGMGLDFSELLQAGSIAVWKAALRYDERQASFSTYAVTAIRNEAMRTIQNEGRTIRIPSGEWEKKRANNYPQPIPMETPSSGNPDLTIADEVASPIVAEDVAEAAIVKQAVKQTLADKLDPLSIQILGLRFGLKDDSPRSCREIGEIIGVSHAAIEQTLERLMAKLREDPDVQTLKEEFFP